MSIAVITGSREARELCAALPDAQPVEWRGDGAALAGHRAIIDASHPCEAATHRDLAMICGALKMPLARYRRPAWRATKGDNWLSVSNPEEARAALDMAWRRVFLCLSRSERTAFADDRTRWFLVRSQRADRAQEKLHLCAFTGKDGTISAASEIALMLSENIDVLVTRNAGGDGAFPKIAAARSLGLPVILIARPGVTCPEFSDIQGIEAWLADTAPR